MNSAVRKVQFGVSGLVLGAITAPTFALNIVAKFHDDVPLPLQRNKKEITKSQVRCRQQASDRCQVQQVSTPGT